MADARVRVLAVATVLLFGLGAIGAATVDDRPESSRVGLSADPGGDQAPGEVTAESSTTAPPTVEETPVAAEGGEPAGGEAAARGIPAPRPGTYRFKQTTKSRSEFTSTTFVNEETEEVERRIERVSESPGQIVDRRHVPSRVTSSGDDGSKSESRSYEERVWRPDGESLAREVHHSTNTAPDGSKSEEESECDWQPDRLQLVFPLRVGLEWSWESSCSGSHDGGEATTTSKGRATVTGTRDIDVGGRSVSTFVIELTGTEDTSGRLGEDRDAKFNSHVEQRTTSFFAPSIGLSVRVEAEQTSDVTFEGSQGGPQNSKTTQTSTAELLSADPS